MANQLRESAEWTRSSGRLDRGGIFGLAIGCVVILALVVGGAVIFLMVRKAVEHTPLAPSQMVYTGDWLGQDGSTLSIRADGSGSFKSGGTSVENGQGSRLSGKVTGPVGLNDSTTIA